MKLNASSLGWLVSAALAAILLGGAFQSPTMKVGTADLEKIVNGSDYYKTNEETFSQYYQKRHDLLQFFNDHLWLTPDEITKVKNLTLVDNATAQQKSDLDRIKEQIAGEQKKQEELSTKPSLTADERNELEGFAHRESTNRPIFQEMAGQFDQDLQQKDTSIKGAAIDKARIAVQAVGRNQGYTLVFSNAACVYSANDITDDAIKNMNATK